MVEFLGISDVLGEVIAMRMVGFAVMLVGCAVCRAEVSCYRTPAQAAVQVGEQEGGGYRLVFVRADALSGRSWATVRSCAHPEWPAVVVSGGVVEARPSTARVGQKEMEHPLVGGGRRVRVVEMDSMTRLETTGVTQNAGRIGDRIPVRIAAASGEGRVVMAVIRSAEMVEIEQ